MSCVPYIDFSVDRTIKRTSDLASELKKNILMKRRSKFVGVVGDWGVGKDSLVLRLLGMDIPDPKEERDHPYVRHGSTSLIPGLRNDPGYFLTFRIIPGKYVNRDKDETFFDHLHPGEYDFDALVFCFALNSMDSFNNFERKWLPKAKIALGYSMPYYMVIGTKSDQPINAISDDQEQALINSTEHAHYSRFSVRNENNLERIRNMLFNILYYREIYHQG